MIKARLLGLLKFVVGAIATMVAFHYLVGIRSTGSQRPFAEFISIPAVFAIMGLIECIAGVPFYRVSAHWLSMDEWKRWSVSILLIGTVFGLIAALLVYYLKYS